MLLLVKGDKFLAAQEAAKRGIPFAFVSEQHNDGSDTGHMETWGRVSEEFRPNVTAWYADPSQAHSVRPGFGFPLGTLLLYREDLADDKRDKEDSSDD